MDEETVINVPPDRPLDLCVPPEVTVAVIVAADPTDFVVLPDLVDITVPFDNADLTVVPRYAAAN